MKKLFVSLMLMVLVTSAISSVIANEVGVGLTPEIITEDFKPLVWMCDNRVMYDDGTEPGRTSLDGTPLVERTNNYAFEGEQISWTVLVMDKNGIEKVEDVYVTVGGAQGEYNEVEVNCKRTSGPTTIPASCGARILEENLTRFNSEVMGYYQCTLTVETSESMYGDYWVTVEAEDRDQEVGVATKHEQWFFNPRIFLSIDGAITFTNTRPGTSSYSEAILVGNDADDGSGVELDMFISGTDFYDSSSSGAMCPTSNQLSLSAFRYYASKGAYSTYNDSRADGEGFVPIQYGVGFNNPTKFYNTHEIMQVKPLSGPYWLPNVLSPGSEMSVIFRLNLPEPCNGDFDTGSIYFWGEAI